MFAPPGCWPQIAPHLLALRPDFLVISPPKTGSTWLAANLRAHSEVFVPAAKELKYFSSLFKWLDPGWYLDQFAAGAGRTRGEASPSYALLPVERIRAVHQLCPELKLVFLMRDPVARAWSHAKHAHRYREAIFARRQPHFEAVTDAEWAEAFAHDWLTASADYLGQLRRWLSVFSPEQVYVGFFEDLAERPAALLRDIFTFLGVDAGVDLSGFPVAEWLMPGPPGELPPGLRQHLRRQLHARTAELTDFLRGWFGLEPPPGWADSLHPPSDPAPAGSVPAFAREFDSAYLGRVLEHEETLPTAYFRVLDAYLGYDIAFCRGRLFAVARTVGAADLPDRLLEADETTLDHLTATGDCHTARNLAELKERVARHVATRTEAHAATLAAELGQARERIAGLEAGLAATTAAVRRLEAEAVRMTQRELVLIERTRRLAQKAVRLWRRLRSPDSGAGSAGPSPESAVF